MILVKNRLKKLKKDKDDEMLNYLKHSHLDNILEDDFILDDTEFENKATQIPEKENKSTQTNKKETEDKGVDTYDELNKIIGEYVLYMDSKKHDNNELMAEAYTQPIQRRERQISSSSSSDREGALSRNLRRRFRLAEFAMNSAVTGANLTMAVANAVGNLADIIVDLTAPNPHSEDEEEDDEKDEVISVHSSPPISISSVGAPETVHSSSAPGSSVPMPTSPQSSRSSSKQSFEGGYPKKKKL